MNFFWVTWSCDYSRWLRFRYCRYVRSMGKVTSHTHGLGHCHGLNCTRGGISVENNICTGRHISREQHLHREAYQLRIKIALQQLLNPTCWKLPGLAACWGTEAGLNWFCCKFVAGFELLARFNLLSTNWFKLFCSLSSNLCRPGLFCCCGVNLCVEAGL